MICLLVNAALLHVLPLTRLVNGSHRRQTILSQSRRTDRAQAKAKPSRKKYERNPAMCFMIGRPGGRFSNSPSFTIYAS